ncbi:hypothetical protein ACWGB8_01755 [Kitasatospora sp. NPDC054939]
MDIAITRANVTGVLLADGWHDVQHGSFDLGPRKFIADQPKPLDKLLAFDAGMGFTFKDQNGRMIEGPLASVLATRS